MFFIFLIPLIPSFFSSVNCTECIQLSNPVIRNFASLEELQGNKISFDPSNGQSKGNDIRFDSNARFSTIKKNSFVTFDSEHIATISLSSRTIDEIENGAFTSLTCTMILELKNNNIRLISQNTFKGLSSLHELDLSNNHIEELPEYTFNSTRRLEKLNLTNNQLRKIDPESFHQLIKLKELDLSYNYLQIIPSDALQYFKNIIHLKAAANNVEQINWEKWKNLKNLRILDLSNTFLRSIDFSYSFSFNGSLEELYVDNNYLTNIIYTSLHKNLPKLKLIAIDKNLWLCQDLRLIIQSLNESKISYAGHTTLKPNYDKIGCNRSIDAYFPQKWIKPSVISTTSQPKTENKTESLQSTNLEILEAINTIKTLLICFFLVFLICVILDIFVRCNCKGFICRRIRINNSEHSEDNDNISLLQETID